MGIFDPDIIKRQYNSPAGEVFDALKCAVCNISKVTVRNIDRPAKTIELSIGVSAFSWGEYITVSVYDTGGGQSAVVLSSAKKMPVQLTRGIGAELIFDALSAELAAHKTPPKVCGDKTVSTKDAGFDAKKASEIRELAALHNEGAITDEEFAEKKKQLLELHPKS